MTQRTDRLQSLRERRRKNGERPLEMWLDAKIIEQIDVLKDQLHLGSRDAVIGQILRTHLAKLAANNQRMTEACTK